MLSSVKGRLNNAATVHEVNVLKLTARDKSSNSEVSNRTLQGIICCWMLQSAWFWTWTRWREPKTKEKDQESWWAYCWTTFGWVKLVGKIRFHASFYFAFCELKKHTTDYRSNWLIRVTWVTFEAKYGFPWDENFHMFAPISIKFVLCFDHFKTKHKFSQNGSRHMEVLILYTYNFGICVIFAAMAFL